MGFFQRLIRAVQHALAAFAFGLALDEDEEFGEGEDNQRTGPALDATGAPMTPSGAFSRHPVGIMTQRNMWLYIGLLDEEGWWELPLPAGVTVKFRGSRADWENIRRCDAPFDDEVS
jgi:hypothetical protein